MRYEIHDADLLCSCAHALMRSSAHPLILRASLHSYYCDTGRNPDAERKFPIDRAARKRGQPDDVKEDVVWLL